MKFALIALVASATAIKLRATAAPCVSMDQSNEVFGMIDTNHDGQINRKELRTAIGSYLKDHPRAEAEAEKLTKDDVKHLKEMVYDAAGDDHKLNPVEFNGLANDMCHLYESQN
jgi:hypothetical protein